MRTSLSVAIGVVLLGAIGFEYFRSPTLYGCFWDCLPRVKSNLRALDAAIDAFATEHHRLPYALDELGAAVSDDPFSPAAQLIDPWDNPYCYEFAGERGYLVTCFGADGIPGGWNDDADIVLDGSAR